MSDTETVRIIGDTPDGFVVINKEDFGEGHVLFVDNQEEQPVLHYAPPEAEAALRNEQAASVDGFLDAVKNKKRKPKA